MGLPVLYLVIPCYNEAAVLPQTAPLFTDKLAALVAAGRIAPHSRVLFVDDGSSDGTWQTICAMAQTTAGGVRGAAFPQPGAPECPAGRAL